MEDMFGGMAINRKILNKTLLAIENPAIEYIRKVSIFYFKKNTKDSRLLI